MEAKMLPRSTTITLAFDRTTVSTHSPGHLSSVVPELCGHIRVVVAVMNEIQITAILSKF
jgi:hypothetical protein